MDIHQMLMDACHSEGLKLAGWRERRGVLRLQVEDPRLEPLFYPTVRVSDLPRLAAVLSTTRRAADSLYAEITSVVTAEEAAA